MNSKASRFRRVVQSYYDKHGRHTLPWRKTRDPYRILVSEVMLQQTQVDRVVPYYRAWLKQFPRVKHVAEAPLSEVLGAWQGLGYNRRAKNLHAAAKALASMKRFPQTPEELEKLPGIGPYTARAVAAFSYNQDVVFIETNIRTAVMHHFFPERTSVTDREIAGLLKTLLPEGRAREWYSALMDYGAHLKRTGVRINGKAKGYVRQTSFKGSSREARGAILKALSQKPHSQSVLSALLGKKRAGQVREQLRALQKEGMIERQGRVFCLPA